ncbi:MAG: HI0074 family nucleotidyltransferase substrate-binding subunit [Pseudomonadota bacterium]
MSDGKITQSLVNLENALSRLREALQEPHHNALIIDGTIQRFEFVLELYWKTLKRLLANEGIEANTPKETLKKAYAAKWIDNETAWLQMLNDRKATSHIYDEETAQRIYKNVQIHFSELEKTFERIKK